MNIHSRTGQVTLVLLVFTAVKLVFALAKIILGYSYGSVAVTGDGMNDLTDIGSSVMIGLSVYLMMQPVNRKHPFGHARIEYVAASVIGVIILYAGVSVFVESVRRIWHHAVPVTEPLLVWVLASSLLVQIVLLLFLRRTKRKVESDMVGALGADAFSDLILTSTVLFSVLVEIYWHWHIDAYVGLMVACVLGCTGLKVIYGGIDKILGKKISPQEEREIISYVNSFDGVHGAHDLIVHDYGPGHRYISIHVEVDSRLDLLSAHEVADKVEWAMQQKYQSQVLIHIDPRNISDPHIAVVENEIRRLVEQIHPQWNVHDFLAVKKESYWDVHFDVSIGDERRESDKEIYCRIRDLIHQHHPEYRISVHIDRHYMISSQWSAEQDEQP